MKIEYNWFLDGFGIDLGFILGPFLGPCWKLFGQLYIKREMCENTNIYYGLGMSEPLENWLVWSLLGSLVNAFQGPCFGMASGPHLGDFGSLWGPFWRPFWALWGYCFSSIFGGFPGLSQSQSRAGVEGDYVVSGVQLTSLQTQIS